MKALLIPDYSWSNPYQTILARGLAARGVDVRLGRLLPLFTASRRARSGGMPDVLHLHWQHRLIVGSSAAGTVLKGASFVAELLALKACGVRIVWTVHNLTSHEGSHAGIELWYSRVLARLCDAIIAHSPAIRGRVMESYGLRAASRIRIIPHPHYIGFYPDAIGRAEARARRGLPQEEFVFLFLGAVKRYKGLDRLIGAFADLKDPSARLLIAGLPQTDAIAREVSGACRGNGAITLELSFVPGEAVQEYLRASDVVVLPYAGVLTSGVAFLAMSFAMPVIAPIPGIDAGVLDAEGAFLYDGAAPGSLRDAMGSALRAGARALGEMGRHNLARMRAVDNDRIAEATRAAYLGGK